MMSQETIENCFPHVGFHSSPESEEFSEDANADLSQQKNCGSYTILDENPYAKIDEDLDKKSEVSIQDIVSNVLNLNTKGSNDQDDSECEKKSVSTSDALKGTHNLKCFFFLLILKQQMNI